MKKIVMIGFFLFFSIWMSVTDVSANSAEPPMVWIVVPGTYDTVEGVLIVDSYVVPAIVRENKFETYIRFYYGSMADYNRMEPLDGSDAEFIITINRRQYSIRQDIRGDDYNQLYTLDMDTVTLVSGTTFVRNASLISLRVISTLILEGLIFFVMGYRQRRTWILFLIVNLITQGFLNIMINSGRPENVYMIFGLIIYETVIIIVEETVLLLSVKEKKKIRLFFTVLIANLLSLFLGGWFILNLPL